MDERDHRETAATDMNNHRSAGATERGGAGTIETREREDGVQIPAAEMQRHASYDLSGYVFAWKGEVYRAVYPAAEERIRALFASGLVEALVDGGLMPGTELTDLRTDDCHLVIRHERIPVWTWPSEWSFDMLKDAACLVLRVNNVARRYGFQTIDAHGFNVTFHYERPLFVDLGSFVPIHRDFGSRRPGWRPLGEFVRTFLAPLRLWSLGAPAAARGALHGPQMPLAEYWRLRSVMLRLVPRRFLDLWELWYFRYKALNTISMEEFSVHASGSRRRLRLASVVRWAARRGLLVGSGVMLERLSRKVQRIRAPRTRTEWGTYHDGIVAGDRFEHIVGLLEKHSVRSVLDMAGNAGFLSRAIAERVPVEHVICADYDENAINALYRDLKRRPARVYPVLLNFAISVGDDKQRSAIDRLRADAVLALALTHHLVLTQGHTIEFVLQRLKRFANRLVLVEFMPLGLYSSKHDVVPTVPAWYTTDWFRTHFGRNFELLEETELERNRVLFVGAVRDES
jgi:hypothetical protein